MGNIGLRYSLILLCITLIFANFVACGAQLFRVSMAGDYDGQRVSPEAYDSSSSIFGIHAPKGWKTVPIRFKLDKEISAEQKRGLLAAMNTWELAVGRTLFHNDGVHDGVTGNFFPDLYSSLNDRINGHYLDDNWLKTGKPQVVLATTIWDNVVADSQAIETADIRFNTNFYKIADSFTAESTDNLEVVDMQTLALHELGHLLGLAHVSQEEDSFSIMNPSLYIGEGLANRRLSTGDVQRIQKIYGCEGESCDAELIAAKIEELDRKSRVSNKRSSLSSQAVQTSH